MNINYRHQLEELKKSIRHEIEKYQENISFLKSEIDKAIIDIQSNQFDDDVIASAYDLIEDFQSGIRTREELIAQARSSLMEIEACLGD